MSMNYAVRQIEGVTILDLSGRVAQEEALGLGQGRGLVLQELVLGQVANGRQKILLNLSEASYIDSSGLGQLVACSTMLRNQGGQLRICNASTRILDLLRITHLESALSLDRDEATALQAFASHQQKGTSAA